MSEEIWCDICQVAHVPIPEEELKREGEEDDEGEDGDDEGGWLFGGGWDGR